MLRRPGAWIGLWLTATACAEDAPVVPLARCGAGEVTLSDETCQAPGIPAARCGAGFSGDGLGGCEPILPAEPCPPGLMAVPGEAACRELAPCGPARFGEPPIEPSTQHVDGSAPAGGDGSELAPWRTIAEAVSAAAPGAIVAIAAGSYPEDVIISGKPVRLWGRCPALVRIEGAAGGLGTVEVHTDASGSEVRRLAVGGVQHGVVVFGSIDVLLEAVWIDGTAGRGLVVEQSGPPTAVTMVGSLVERTRDIGVSVAGATVTVRGSVIRDTQAGPNGSGGRAISIQNQGTQPARLELSGSLLERNREMAVFVRASELALDTTVIRDTAPTEQGTMGRGINLRDDAGMRSSATLATSLIERSSDIGLYLADADVAVDALSVRDIVPDALGLLGRCVSIDAVASRSTVAISDSLFARCQDHGVFVLDSDVTMRGVAVRDVGATGFGFGRGIGLQPAALGGATLELEAAIIERCAEVGLNVAGSTATVRNTAVRDVQSRGINVQNDPESLAPGGMTLSDVVVERTRGFGLAVSSATLAAKRVAVRTTTTKDDGSFGDGIAIFSALGPATADLADVAVHDSARAAVAGFGASVSLRNLSLSCQAFDLAAEEFSGMPSAFEDRGGNLCGCPDPQTPCKAVSAGLTPPPLIE